VDSSFAQIDSRTAAVLDAYRLGALGPKDARGALENLTQENGVLKESLKTALSYVTRDIDDYFAGRLRFFGDAFMTLTMVMPSDLPKGASYDMGGVDMAALDAKVALKGIDVVSKRKIPAAAGINPTIPELLGAAGGAGFVNAPVDADGLRRRVDLIARYKDSYYGELILVPLLERLGGPRIRVTDTKISLLGATLGSTKKDIVIPRADDGSVLLNWPKKKFADFNVLSLWQLVKGVRMEKELLDGFKTMERNGYFAYWEGEKTPVEAYGEASYVLDELSAGLGADEGLSQGSYAEYKAAFFAIADSFLNGGTEGKIVSSLGRDEELQASVTASFSNMRELLSNLVEVRKRVRERTGGASCIIGVEATSMTDVGVTTYQERFPNVGTYYTLANMVLSGNFLDDSPPYVSVLIALCLSFILTYLIYRKDIVRALLTGFAALAITILGTLAFFALTKRYLGLAVPFISEAIVFVSISIMTFLRTGREKSFLRSAFSRYLSPAVINEIISDPSKLNLGGEKREMTAIFTDIRGFSGISEKLDPTDLVKLLNHYLTAMSDIVLQNRGTIDKYEGDAIIAFFGAPIRMEDHAAMACKTAIMMKRAEVELNRRIREEGLSPSPLFTRIGINTGEMVVGNMGTANQMNYTIMGHAVNLAARLEGVNKQYGTGGILISEYTREKIGEAFLVRRLDRVRVVGVSTPLRLYELLGLAEEGAALVEPLAAWEKGIDLYESRRFAEAKAAFSKGIGEADGVAEFYAKRCEDLMAAPPGADWDGVANLTTK
jgi:adenylate cyclase